MKEYYKLIDDRYSAGIAEHTVIDWTEDLERIKHYLGEGYADLEDYYDICVKLDEDNDGIAGYRLLATDAPNGFTAWLLSEKDLLLWEFEEKSEAEKAAMLEEFDKVIERRG